MPRGGEAGYTPTDDGYALLFGFGRHGLLHAVCVRGFSMGEWLYEQS